MWSAQKGRRGGEARDKEESGLIYHVSYAKSV
jgi:hypothetical protein